MEKNSAKEVVSLILRHNNELRYLIDIIKSGSQEEEYKFYRNNVAKIIALGFTDIVEPLCKEHPDLTPEQMIQKR